MLKPTSRLASLAGLESTVGVNSPEAVRWLSVALPSLLGQIMTMGELAMVLPKPIAIHPTVLEPVDERLYWVVEFGNTMADMHMYCR